MTDFALFTPHTSYIHIHEYIYVIANNLKAHMAGTETQKDHKDGQNEGQQWQQGRGGGSERVKGWGENLESIRWLSWSCLHSCGSESGRETRELGVWVLCHECVHLYKHQHTNATTVYARSLSIWWQNLIVHVSILSILNVFGHLVTPIAPLVAEESSCSQKSPTSPSLEVKVEGKNGWLAPTQVMSTQQLSIFPLHNFPSLLLCIPSSQHFVLYCLPWWWEDLTWNKRKNNAQTGTL